jgi:hypothetical protein
MQQLTIEHKEKEDYEKMSKQLDLLAKEAGMVRRYQQKMSLYNLEMLI